MRKLGNTLYITSQGSYLAKDGECMELRRDDGSKNRVPLHNIDGIATFGQVSASPYFLGHCASTGTTVSYFSEYGRFLARAEGPVSGNVLLRKAQYAAMDHPEQASSIIRSMLVGKISNQRHVLRRALRDHASTLEGAASTKLEEAQAALARALKALERQLPVERLRGIEGDAAATYFGVFNDMIRSGDPAFSFKSRSRRPPLDPINCLLSFAYSILTHDVRSALEGVGLDPAAGYLHALRPGRPSLALDVLEEFRAWFADRLVLSLINRNQIKADGFETQPGGAVQMTDETRASFLCGYQERKREVIQHPFTRDKAEIGLMWHIQARLLASYLRGSLDAYVPFLAR